ncbi:isochorismatase family protein [Streptacidiphilus sp. EB129]|uniref:isochorismatase family protein n=1 Tax=Streptacidiphilus sp. EB129 TaxID=3156262 RepID=UPI0035125FBD
MPGIPVIEPYPMPVAAELPANTAEWTVDPERAVLLVHDMQRFFLRPFVESAQPVGDLVRNASRLRGHAVRNGVPIAYTAQPGGMTPQERGLLKDFWGPGMTPSAEDRTVVPPIAPDEPDWVFVKWRYSAFHRTDLLDRMRTAGRDQLLVCGVYAHVGVLTTLNDAFAHDIQSFLVADAVADFSADYHQQALRYAAERCAMVLSTDQVIKELP